MRITLTGNMAAVASPLEPMTAAAKGSWEVNSVGQEFPPIGQALNEIRYLLVITKIQSPAVLAAYREHHRHHNYSLFREQIPVECPHSGDTFTMQSIHIRHRERQ